jgi:hypothetical protein
VPALAPFDYAIVRVVPRVEREEFINAGVVLHAPTLAYLACMLHLDRGRLAALAPDVDGEPLARHLDAFRRVCAAEREAGPIAALPLAERFHWLVAPRSTQIQTSAVYGGVCEDPAAALRELFERRVG